MPTITIRNLPDKIIESVKESAVKHGMSMENEIRETLKIHYMIKKDVVQRVQDRKGIYPQPEAKDIQNWIDKGRE